MKSLRGDATGPSGRMLVFFGLACIICWSEAYAHTVEQYGTGYVIVDDSTSLQTAGQSIDAVNSQLDDGLGYIRGHRYQLVSVGNAAGSGNSYHGADVDGSTSYNGYTNGYSSLSEQQLSDVRASYLSVNAAGQTGSNSLVYQTQESSENGALGSSGRSGGDPGFEPLNSDDSVHGGHSSTELLRKDDDEEEEGDEEEDDNLQKTQLQVDYSEENDDGNLQINLENDDDEAEKESNDAPKATGRVAKAGHRRRRRQKKIKPKVIIVKKIVPVSTTTYLYRG